MSETRKRGGRILSTDAWKIIVPGNPVAQPRHRVSSIGGRTRTYLPSKHPVHAFKQAIKMIAAMGPVYEGPVSVHIEAFFGVPKSWSQKKRDAYFCKSHTQKPDADNVAKAVLDALCDHWKDDCQVFRLEVVKFWGPPQTIITVREY